MFTFSLQNSFMNVIELLVDFNVIFVGIVATTVQNDHSKKGTFEYKEIDFVFGKLENINASYENFICILLCALDVRMHKSYLCCSILLPCSLIN